MKVRFNGKEVDVLEASGPEVYGVADGLLWGLGVEEREFPSKGVVYLLQTSENATAKELRDTYGNISGMARERGDAAVPSLEDIMSFDGFVRFKAQYELVHPAKGETAMSFLKVGRDGGGDAQPLAGFHPSDSTALEECERRIVPDARIRVLRRDQGGHEEDRIPRLYGELGEEDPGESRPHGQVPAWLRRAGTRQARADGLDGEEGLAVRVGYEAEGRPVQPARGHPPGLHRNRPR